MPHAQRGGCGMAQTRNAADPLSFMSLIPLLLSPVNRPATLRTREIEKDESDPPQNRGVMRPFVEARCGVPSTRPHGVALVLTYPCGKAWKNPPFPSGFIVPDRSAPSRVRFAAPGRSEGMTVYEGKWGVDQPVIVYLI